jgi:hypothetical protein
MMYNNKLVTVLKSQGKILREFKDTTYIPFGSEFSILIKNLNSVRAQVRITVDGQDATEGVSLVIAPNSSLELERFIKNGNMHEGNRFKFIERTAGVESHRGIQIEDGLIRVEFQFEKVLPKPVHVPIIHDHYDRYPWNPPYYGPVWYGDRNPDRRLGDVWCDNTKSVTTTTTTTTTGPLRTSNIGDHEVKTSGFSHASMQSPGASGSLGGDSYQANVGQNTAFVNQVRGIQCSASGGNAEVEALVDHYRAKQEADVKMSKSTKRFLPQNEAGITVPGSKSKQQFNWVQDFNVEDEVHVMVIKLLGETQTGHIVKAAVGRTKQHHRSVWIVVPHLR